VIVPLLFSLLARQFQFAVTFVADNTPASFAFRMQVSQRAHCKDLEFSRIAQALEGFCCGRGFLITLRFAMRSPPSWMIEPGKRRDTLLY
jgi:hypothetical protein